MGLFSHNAGPGRIHQLRQSAATKGLDPNVWFDNVEMVAAEKIGMETVTYVSNIFRFDLYLLICTPITSPLTMISTRRFCFRPAMVLLSAIGSAWPSPLDVMVSADNP
jgi:hypothetical protein